MKGSIVPIDIWLHSSSQKDGVLTTFSLAGARMVFAGAKKRSTRVTILPRGGVVFLLDSQCVKLSVRMTEVHMSGSPSYAFQCKPGRGSGCTISFTISTRNTNGFFPFFPIRSAHGQYKSGQVTGHGTASMAVCED